MKKSFFEHDKPLLTTMVQADNPNRIKELIDKSIPDGAEAFGMQFEQMKSEYRTKEVYKDLFSYVKDKPVYVTNYRHAFNEGKTDDMLAEELVELAECGADLCDIVGDYFDRQPDEVAVDKTAIEKQKELIRRIHDKGAAVLMSSHILKYTPAERVLEVALEHQSRGADICKIVTGAETMEQQLENLKIINMLKENLKIPFLFLCGGECGILRRIGGELGCCMYLCVHEYDALATPQQPLLKKIKMIRDNMK
ncbi:MAG: type I 3-dehydroquinate dehydratase [Clostridiales bacterium]|nr:type I 3-dehydroquinate dehydratase [Clostridiales bacterium]